ncbi:hypothetical protein BJ980_003037 [Nocardioides daedukensis]|uniref:DUF8017 domain-containing protein n=1 Tax=Nocardioides daedukensis TaxID=634462 RepID=A0A7Y9S5H4_9ACTN|nr:hypothetical protein [Nocardioides daedukensis]NYG60114.1 hypothetical protein [Nocardioides daedukensis]
MSRAPIPSLRSLTRILGAASVVLALTAASTAGVVGFQETAPVTASASGHADWKPVVAEAIDAGLPTTYAVPGGHDWVISPAGDDVAFPGSHGRPKVTGTGAARWFGNDCTEDGTPIAGAWVVVADPERGRAREVAVRELESWARGYATNDRGRIAPMSQRQVSAVTLADGSAAVQASVRFDMSVFEAGCAGRTAEMLVTCLERDGRVVTLVQARHLGVPHALSERAWRGIWKSLALGE